MQNNFLMLHSLLINVWVSHDFKLKLNAYLTLQKCSLSLWRCWLGMENLDKLVMILKNWPSDARTSYCSLAIRGMTIEKELLDDDWKGVTLKMSSRVLGTLKMQSYEVCSDSKNILIRLLTLYSFHQIWLCQWCILHKSNVIYKGVDFFFSCTHFLTLNLHLNLFMSDVGCSLAEPSSMSLVSFCFFNSYNLVFIFQH